MRVEKRVAIIIKWLERLKKSYSSGAMESALMDAECARADLEDLRLDVWAEVSPSAHRNSAAFSRVLGCVRTLSLSLVIVIASVVPLSREVKAPAAEPVRSARAYAGPIVVFREYEAPVTEQTLTPEHTTKTEQKIADSSSSTPSSPKKQPTQKRTASKRAQTPARPDPKPKPAGTVPYDKVYSLIQTGQRALKNDSSVIKIQ